MKANEAVGKILDDAQRSGGFLSISSLVFIESIDDETDKQLLKMLFKKMEKVSPPNRGKDPDIQLLIAALEDRGVDRLTRR